MTEDATLSTFGVDSSDGEDDDSSSDGSESDGSKAKTRKSDGSESDDESPTSLSTYAWGPHVCRQCDAESTRVWRDGEGVVCPDCKEW
ncbi:hypothetical protein AB7C87_13120 [Natrarchaeobius sp. A-rgal3]|uniref:DUF7573 domain-containing protein n=1 Tax=Natrarchaeobius versutus TaxID=1679078 RepID=UPI00350F87EA